MTPTGDDDTGPTPPPPDAWPPAPPPDDDPWMRRAQTITAVWNAIRAPLCWTLAAGLMVFATVSSRYGHRVDPDLIVLIGALFGFPFFFRDGGKP